jgi:hypothetical protein
VGGAVNLSMMLPTMVAHEFFLVPTSGNPEELSRAADVLGDLGPVSS